MKGDGIIKLTGRTYWYTDFYWQGQQIRRSTKTTERVVAKKRAAAIYEKFVSGHFGELERKKLSNNYATFGEVIERYQPNPRLVKPMTRDKNVSALRSFLRSATGKTGKKDVDDLRVNLLSRELVLAYQRAREAAADPDDELEQEAVAIGANSTLTQARSVFAAKWMDLYKDLKMPDLAEFRAVPRLKVEANTSYVPLSQGQLDAMEKAAKGVKETQPGVFVAYILLARLGLRNSEASSARWHWLERQQDGAAMLAVIRRTDFVPKNKSGRRVPVARETVRILDEFRRGEDDFILPADSKTERVEWTFERLNALLRPIIGDRQKCAYELRKHAGSIVASRQGLEAAKAFLGHHSIQTTERHYATYLRRVEPITEGDYQPEKAKQPNKATE